MARVLTASAACLLGAVALVAVATASGDGPLAKAVKAGDLPTVRALVKSGTDVNSLSGDGSVGSSRVDLQACKLEYSIVSPK